MSLPPCANTERAFGDEARPCLEPARNACGGCLLVQYCSKDCQRAHWSLHKPDCRSPLIKTAWRPSWVVENREPIFVIKGIDDPGLSYISHGGRKFLWGNMPALDLLNLKWNEGAGTDRDLRLLLAASGDLRNLVKSVTDLPKTYSGKLGIVLNDREIDIVARNAILLLTALHFDTETAAPIMLHLWYSALIPAHMLQALQDNILPLFEDVCQKIEDKSAEALLSKTWTYGNRSLCLVLQKEQWKCLPSYFKVPEGLSPVGALGLRESVTLAPTRKDILERALFAQPPGWRVCNLRFRKDGILLPFGSSRKEFDTPNPTFYQSKDEWPMEDSADPLSGWSLEEVLQKAPIAKDDIYGSLFFYLQDVLSKFCDRLGSLSINFQFFQLDAQILPEIAEGFGAGKNSFDRIEVSNITDDFYLGLRTTLHAFGPLLKRPAQNQYATMITLFINAVYLVIREQGDFHDLPTIRKLFHYIPLASNTLREPTKNPYVHQALTMQYMLYDWNKVFDQYMQEHCPVDVCEAVGLAMSAEHTIVPRWPTSLGDNPTQQKFDQALASTYTGNERYVEWKAVD